MTSEACIFDTTQERPAYRVPENPTPSRRPASRETTAFSRMLVKDVTDNDEDRKPTAMITVSFEMLVRMPAFVE